MLTLNNDCQLCILKYLSLKDQLALWLATNGEATSRWICTLRYFWQRQRRFLLDAAEFKILEGSRELLNDFLCSISPNVQHLELWSVTLYSLTLWTLHEFPEMRSLEYSTEKEDGDRDHYIKFLNELFPYLNHMSHLTNWMTLRRVDLNKCPRGNVEELEKVEDLILQTDGRSVGDENKIMELPRLRTLTIPLEEEYHYRFLRSKRAEDIEKLTFLNVIWDWDWQMGWGEYFLNLRQLSVVNDTCFKDTQLVDYCASNPRLERLDLYNFENLNSEKNLWEIVEVIPTLKILNLSGPELYLSFFDNSREPMKKVLDKRTMPLTLYCHDMGLNTHQIHKHFQHPNLKVKFEQLEIDHVDDEFLEYGHAIRLDWRPLEKQ